MGKVVVVLSNSPEARLRREVVRSFGGKKGDLSRAVEDAVIVWLARKKAQRRAE